MRLKRTLLAVTTVFAALLGLNGCGSDSGSSVLQRDVDGVWSYYEPNYCEEIEPNVWRGTCFENAQMAPVPSDPPIVGVSNALAYDGFRNKPTTSVTTRNMVLQLTNEGNVNQICDTCGQKVGGSRLYGKFMSINHRFLCTPDLDSDEKPIRAANWLKLYGTLDGTRIEGTVTGNINQTTCSRDENSTKFPGPNNCAPDASGTDGVALSGDPTFTSQTADFTEYDVGLPITIDSVEPPTCGGCAPTNLTTTIAAVNSETSVELAVAPSNSVNPATWTKGLVFPATFQHAVEMKISAELQWEPWQETIFGKFGFCKMVFTYDKVAYPNTNVNPEIEAPAGCNEMGEFELYKSSYQPTNTLSANCSTDEPPDTGVKWSQRAAQGGCETRDAYRWGPIAMIESDCLDTYVSE